MLTTRQRPDGENPNTPDEFQKLWAASPTAHGARYQRKISDGFNPFGSSDFYYDVGTIYYYYPGRRNPGVISADTWEIYGALGWKWANVKVSYNLDDYFGARPTGQKTDGTWYIDLSAAYPVGETGVLVVCRGGGRARFRTALFEDPRVGAVGDLAQQEQVIAAKGVGGFPGLRVPVEALEGDVEADAAVGVVLPDGCLDGAQADLLHRLMSRGGGG